MTLPSSTPTWKAPGLLALALVLGLGLQAMQTSAAEAPGVALLATDPSALAGTSTGAFTIVRHGDSNLSLTINLGISGTAANGVDYAALGNVLTLDPGVLALDVVVSPVINPANRGNKTVVLTVESNAAYAVYGKGTATVKITDDLYDVPPPTVSVSSPADGSVFTAPATVTLSANVSDPEIPIGSVSFYANDTFVGRVTNAPYTLVMPNVHAGKYAIFARAVDEFGKSAVSTPVDITVSDTPVVTLSTADGSSTYFQGQTVPLQAAIGDPNEAISSVGFYVNSKLVGTATTAPFTFGWTPTKTGTFNVQAIATDANSGKKGSSAKLAITITQSIGQ
jgi:hypothetical protein